MWLVIAKVLGAALRSLFQGLILIQEKASDSISVILGPRFGLFLLRVGADH